MKKKNRNWLIVVILILLMAFLTIRFFASSSGKEVIKGFKQGYNKEVQKSK